MATPDDPSASLPGSVELLWGARAPRSRGPKPALSIDQVVGTAIAIADAEGLAALSMRRIAERLGFTTMSLYRHVPGKDELVDLMIEHAVGRPVLDDDDTERVDGGRAGVEAWARQLRAGYLRHPWLLSVPISGPPMGPNSLAWLDAGLRALAGIGISGGPAVGGVMTLLAYVRGQAELAVGMTAAAQDTGIAYDEWGPIYGRVLKRFVTAEEYPMLAELVASGVFSESDPAVEDEADEDFEFGLQRVLDGLEAYAVQYGVA